MFYKLHKSILFLAFVLFLTNNSFAKPTLADIKKIVLIKAEEIRKKYDPEICPTITQTYEIITSKEGNESWQHAFEIIQSIDEMIVYKKALESMDDIYWSELITQATIMSIMKTQNQKNNLIITKTSAIVSCYLEILKSNMHNQK